MDGRLHLTGPLQGTEPGASRKIGQRELIAASRARSHRASAQAGIDIWSRSPYNLDSIASGRQIAKITVVIKERGRVEARANRNLRHARLQASGGDAASPAAVHEAQRELVAVDKLNNRGAPLGYFPHGAALEIAHQRILECTAGVMVANSGDLRFITHDAIRSEERRVGKECRS